MGFFLIHRIALYRGMRRSGGGREILYVAVGKLLGSAAKERRHSFLHYCAVQEAAEYWMEKISNTAAWGIHLNIFSTPPFPVPTSKTRSWVLPNIELMARMKRVEDRYTVKPTSVARFVCRRLCRRLHIPYFNWRPVLWTTGAGVISTSGTTGDSIWRHVLGLCVCEWVVSCGRLSGAKRRKVSFTLRLI